MASTPQVWPRSKAIGVLRSVPHVAYLIPEEVRRVDEAAPRWRQPEGDAAAGGAGFEAGGYADAAFAVALVGVHGERGLWPPGRSPFPSSGFGGRWPVPAAAGLAIAAVEAAAYIREGVALSPFQAASIPRRRRETLAERPWIAIMPLSVFEAQEAGAAARREVGAGELHR